MKFIHWSVDIKNYLKMSQKKSTPLEGFSIAMQIYNRTNKREVHIMQYAEYGDQPEGVKDGQYA